MTEALGVDPSVSRETRERLALLSEMILTWTQRINLIAPSTRADIWRRHIEDSVQLWALAPPTISSWIDLGSGAGLPGLVIAAIAAEKAPGLSVTLVEADQRKAVFLRHAAAQLDIHPVICASRIERMKSVPYDVVSARALAPLPRLLDLAYPFVGNKTVLILPKGANVDSELTAARRRWHIRGEKVPSQTDPAATILKILELEPLS